MDVSALKRLGERLLLKDAVFISMVVATVFVVYSFALQGGFKTVDDEVSIVFNPYIHNFDSWKHLFTSSFFGENSYYRPLVMASFSLEYQLFGLKSIFYIFNNIALHSVNAVLVFFLMKQLTGKRNLACWVCILFALHPIQWEAVANIAGRSIVLSTFFSTLSIYLFMQWDKAYRTPWLLCSLAAFGLGLFSKESSIAVVGILLLYKGVFSKNFHRRPIDLLALGCFVIIAGGMVVLRQVLGISNLAHWGHWSGHFVGFVTFFKGLGGYIQSLIFPFDLRFSRSIPYITSFSSVLWGTIGIWIFAGTVFWYCRNRFTKLIWFALGFVVLELLPVSQIVLPIMNQPKVAAMSEHFLYMTSIPLFLLLVLLWRFIYQMVLQKQWVQAKVLRFLVGLWLLCCLAFTAYYAHVASSEYIMLKRALAYEPMHLRNLYSMGLLYTKLEDFAKAEEQFRICLILDPSHQKARIALARALVDQGKKQEALAELRHFRNVDAQLQEIYLRTLKEATL